MTSWMRRLRGALGMAAAWAVAWAPIGALFGLGLTLILAPPVPMGAVIVGNAKAFAALGFAGGWVFSAVLRFAEAKKRFEELSLRRFVGLGALGGLLLGGFAVVAGFWGPGLQLADAVITVGSTLMGAGSAGATLAIAQAADDDALRAPDAGSVLSPPT